MGRFLLLGLASDVFCQAATQGGGPAVEAIIIVLVIAVPLYVVLRFPITWAASKLRSIG